jgi:DMSO/TMAO reductase YedYZ molybdopterin-dependent catalytic subunit
MKKRDYFDRTETVSSSSFRKRSVIAFLIFIVLGVAAFYSWKWLNNQPQEAGALKPLRKGLTADEKIFSSYFSKNRLAKTYAEKDAVKNVRVNGDVGMPDSVNINTWRLNVVRAPGDTLKISYDELKQLPKKDVIFDFKCIEGWSQVTHWAGIPLKDFMDHYHLQAQEQMNYAGLHTADNQYYVGIDMESFLQPQTILCLEMNGQPLPMNQGFPVRLIIPVKYGIKHLKAISVIYFSNQKPPDYWAERGYDYYAGL